MGRKRGGKKRRDLYQEVTNRIIEALRNGVVPWRRPWQIAAADAAPRNAITRRPYNGVNVFLLWMTAGARGYESNEWMTYNQAKKAGGQVRKGERGTTVYFWKTISIEEEDEDTGEVTRKRIPLMREFTVFNRAQVDGLPAPKDAPVPLSEPERNARADEFIAATGAVIRHGGSRAGYSPERDDIVMPPRASFKDAAGYYSTALHELAHWTGHPTRMARDLSGTYGSAAYAFEELVAEMGAAFLCADLEIDGDLQHPEYIANWIRVLEDDSHAITRAASQARQAAEFLGAGAGAREADGAAEEAA